ncbi:hypothetical protein F4777DRAFT_569066 [Nemania sp. FL0916]|nr:hypothetical protein F4777DRAFT_569066 [Nemania sp. FL0916]
MDYDPQTWSTEEYSFADEQTDAILRFTSLHRQEFSRFAIWFMPATQEKFRSAMITQSDVREEPPPHVLDRMSRLSLGVLDRLPPEIFLRIILRLDMSSLVAFRSLNVYSRSLVDSLHEYRAIVAHGSNLFLALLRTRLAKHVSLSQFYEALCTETCGFCGNFAGFVSILPWKRCCIDCIQQNKEIRLEKLCTAKHRYRLSEADARQLRSLEFLPGPYGPHKQISKLCQCHRLVLTSEVKSFAAPEAIQWAEQNAVYEEIAPRQLPPPRRVQLEADRRRLVNFMGACALPYYQRLSEKSENGEYTMLDVEDARNVEHRRWCAACTSTWRHDANHLDWTPGFVEASYRFLGRIYGKDEFLQHFRWCKQAQALWDASEGGTGTPHPAITNAQEYNEEGRMELGIHYHHMPIRPGRQPALILHKKRALSTDRRRRADAQKKPDRGPIDPAVWMVNDTLKKWLATPSHIRNDDEPARFLPEEERLARLSWYNDDNSVPGIPDSHWIARIADREVKFITPV